MRIARALVVSLVVAVPALAAIAGDGRKERHVVVVSIDSLRPEFYLSSDFDTPTLKGLAAQGAYAKGVEPVYPSVTYAGHASIVTGVRPATHGIVSNTEFDEHGAEPEWRWEASELHAKPLWRAAEEQGEKVAVVMWPTTVGAQVKWLVPERWGVRGDSTKELLLRHSTKGLLLEVALALGVSSIDSTTLADTSKIDEFVAGAAAHVIETRKPDLLLVHLIQCDHEQHAHGRDAASVKAAVARTDKNVARLIAAVAKAGLSGSTVFAIVGDHGMVNVTRSLAPNTLLAKAKLAELDADGSVKSWQALGHAHGGSMSIHAKTPEAARRAHEILEAAATKDGETLYRIIERAELDQLGADPSAAFWLEPADGISFSGAGTGAFLSKPHAVRGTHGGLPTKPQLQTGFILRGPGVRARAIEHMRLIDEAPTLAKLMGVELSGTEGGVLDVLDAEPY